MRSLFNRIGNVERRRRPRSCRLAVSVDGLERREVMTGGSVIGAGAIVEVIPGSTGPNTTVVSYQMHNGSTMLDVNLNGGDHFFSASQVTTLYYLGYGASGSQMFQDHTGLNVTALGGSGSNTFDAGSGSDTFYGGSGSNTFDAGTGFDFMVGGTGTNVYNENANGFGIIEEFGGLDTVNSPDGSFGGGYVLLLA